METRKGLAARRVGGDRNNITISSIATTVVIIDVELRENTKHVPEIAPPMSADRVLTSRVNHA